MTDITERIGENHKKTASMCEKTLKKIRKQNNFNGAFW